LVSFAYAPPSTGSGRDDPPQPHRRIHPHRRPDRLGDLALDHVMSLENMGDAPSLRESPAAENGPALWDAILARFPAGSIVAGGAVRDYLLGVPAKDVDVFLSVTNWPDSGLEGFERLGSDRADEYAAMPTICIVQRGRIGGVQVDAVGVFIRSDPMGYEDAFTPQAVIETFDFGLTRCWYDGQIHDTPEARADREARAVTLLLGDRPARAEQRFARFNERMGGGWALLGHRKDGSSQQNEASQ